MKQFKDKTAVITGAASGIGKAIAEKCVKEKMKVVLADIEPNALIETEKEMESVGADVISVITDVSKAGDVENLAKKILDKFGAVHLLFNNAGVQIVNTICESTLADWEWVIGVNLWGVIYGVKTFLPIMLAQNTECHIINTASVAALISNPYIGIYKVSKHGVIGLSETLYCELAQKNSKIKVSVLCPEWVNTHIMDSDRNRPDGLKNKRQESSAVSKLEQSFRKRITEKGMSPAQVADCVFQGIIDEKLYIITHPETKKAIQIRMEDIINERNPNI